MKLPILPIYYYRDHFTEMLSFVTKTYGAVLTERHSKFIATFNALSKDAQCLLIRMINRRGRVFRHAAFRYHEIGDPVRALAELSACGQIQPLGEDDYAAFIVCLPKDALIKGGKSAGLTDIRTSCIFVAHNVNFDYGFISYEYARLERRFRFPKLCTCAGMRRRYPGHESYSLGNLTDIYSIDLKDHHRALCDARAAAHLLNLINEKRGNEPKESEIAA